MRPDHSPGRWTDRLASRPVVSWQTPQLVREGLANLRANVFRSLLMGAVGAAAFGGLASLELQQGAGLEKFARDYAGSGGYVAVTGISGGQISAPRCESLNGEPGVVAAGAWRSVGQATFASAPGVLFQSIEATPHLLSVWDANLRTTGIEAEGGFVAGDALAKELGLVQGSALLLRNAEPARLAEIGRFAHKNPQAARWLISPVPPAGRFDECWVEFEPGAFSAGIALLPARLADASGEPATRPYRRSDEFKRDPAAEWAERPQRLGWIAVSLLMFGLALGGAWFRRAEYALYLAIGTGRLELAVMAAAEQWIVLAVAWGLGVAYAIALAAMLGQQLSAQVAVAAVFTPASAALLAAAALLWCPVLVARGSIAGLLKDR